MSAHAKGNAEVLTKQIELLFQVRGAWEQVDKPVTQPGPTVSSAGSFGARESEDSSADLAMSWNA